MSFFQFYRTYAGLLFQSFIEESIYFSKIIVNGDNNMNITLMGYKNDRWYLLAQKRNILPVITINIV